MGDVRREWAASCRARLFFLLVPIVLGVGGAVFSQEFRPGARPVGIDHSLVATKRLAGARDFIGRGDWDAAIGALDQLSRDYGDALVEVASGRYLNVAEASAAHLAQLPQAGLTEYRLRVDPLMKPLYEEALRRDDAAAMRKIVRDGFASSYGDDALWWLGEDAWEHGELESARAYWTAMLPLPQAVDVDAPLVMRYPDAEAQPAAVRARLVLCSIMEGDHVQAVRELEAFRRLHPEARGMLAGVDGHLAETIEKIATASRDKYGPSHVGRTPSDDSARPRISDVRWRVALHGTGLPLIERPRPALPRIDPVAYVPVLWETSVLVTDGRTVRAFDLATGAPTWPTGWLM